MVESQSLTRYQELLYKNLEKKKKKNLEGLSWWLSGLRLPLPMQGTWVLSPGQGTRSHMLQLRVCKLRVKISCATTRRSKILCATSKTWCSQIHKQKIEEKKRKRTEKLNWWDIGTQTEIDGKEPRNRPIHLWTLDVR